MKNREEEQFTKLTNLIQECMIFRATILSKNLRIWTIYYTFLQRVFPFLSIFWNQNIDQKWQTWNESPMIFSFIWRKFISESMLNSSLAVDRVFTLATIFKILKTARIALSLLVKGSRLFVEMGKYHSEGPVNCTMLSKVTFWKTNDLQCPTTDWIVSGRKRFEEKTPFWKIWNYSVKQIFLILKILYIIQSDLQIMKILKLFI